MKKRILTGITTTGTPHIGNYIGAIRPALKMANSEDKSFFFLSDYPAVTKNQDSSKNEKSSLTFTFPEERLITEISDEGIYVENILLKLTRIESISFLFNKTSFDIYLMLYGIFPIVNPEIEYSLFFCSIGNKKIINRTKTNNIIIRRIKNI